jgi:ligand-binding sensor domain-containing protein/signal transduction histidine kinase
MRPPRASNRLILLVAALACCGIGLAERLPFRHLTTQEGLAGNTVHSVVRDSRGLLWFCTNDGLSRFDGHSSINFGTDDGLGDQEVTHLLEASDGVYWVGTARGVARMDVRSAADGSVSFTNFLPGDDPRSQWIHELMQDHAGRIWIATNGGLYRMSTKGVQNPVFEHIPLPSPAERPSSPRVLEVVEDRSGQIWAGGDRGLHKLLDNGSIEHYSTADGLPGHPVLALALDTSGALWTGVDGGLCRVRPRKHGRSFVDSVYKLSDGLPDGYVTAIHASSEWLWAGTANGLLRLPVTSGGNVQVFGTANGLRHPSVESLEEDQQGNIWIGTMGGGASRLSANGFTTYGSADGLASVEIAGFAETSTGELLAISKGGDQFAFNRFDGIRFGGIRPRFPPGVTRFGWGWAQIALQGTSGEWWIATSQGLVGYPRVTVDQLTLTKARAFFRTSRELPRGTVFRVFADSRRNVWISTSGYSANGLTRWERSTGRIQKFGSEDGLPTPVDDDRSLASAFAEDDSGNIWIGFHGGGLYRFRAGRLIAVHSRQGAGIEGVRWIHCDTKGRLWIAGRNGLHRLEEPGLEPPVFRHYGTEQGLVSKLILSVTEDHLGRIYVGSGHGVDRLDPKTGNVRHYGTADGLVGGEVRVAHRDKHGYLWFGSLEGLSRYDPRPERRLPAPNVYISEVRIGGYVKAVGYPGELQVSVRPLNWRHNSLHVHFLGVGERLRFEYQLSGVDSGWSEIGDTHSVHYAGLDSGTYRFNVRAVNTEGVWSPQPAAVQFRIEPPFWRTWWLRLLSGSLVLAAAFVVHRMRIAKAVAVERMRNRIATDLHDDVGASLCHAALLSDLLQCDETIRNPTARERLMQISTACRKAVDSMGDVIWAIDPEKDTLNDLIQRMRNFAEEVLTCRNIDLRFSDGMRPEIKLPSGVRHQLFLVFKEAMHNVVRHSGATAVEVDLCTEGRRLMLRISDNGRGLPPDSDHNGYGLRSMRERVTTLGGRMRLDKGAEGNGVTLRFAIPLASPDR